MKIGVMTFWWSQDNYGQLLQCYALQKYLRDHGHDAYLVKYKIPDVQWNWKQKIRKYVCHPWRLIHGVRQVMLRWNVRDNGRISDRQFDEFRGKYCKFSENEYSTLASLRENPPPADMYIVGSDQVWNNCDGYLTEDVIRAYFLDFGDEKVKRVSYAASWGRDMVGVDEIPLITPLLKKFDAVSVRERSGCEICKALSVDSTWVCDPTFLLNVDDYRQIMELPSLVRGYVFVYILANDSLFSYRAIDQWARRHGLDIVYVKGNVGQLFNFDDKGAAPIPLTIPQWLGYLSKAKYVVTNSFHCCAFSCIFGRPVGVIPLKGSAARGNNRIADLRKLTGRRIFEIDNGDYDLLLVDEVERDDCQNCRITGESFLSQVLR